MTDIATAPVVQVTYSKRGPLIYVAHLDTMETLLRALRRADVPYALTQGCHHRPKIQFGPPLPMGHAGHCEFFYVTLRVPMDPAEICQRLNEQLPPGIDLIGVKSVRRDEVEVAPRRIDYLIRFQPDSERAITAVCRYLSDPNWHFDCERKGTIKVYRLGSAVQAVRRLSIEGAPALLVDFCQGEADLPSVSKVLTAVIAHLGDDREEVLALERLRFPDLPGLELSAATRSILRGSIPENGAAAPNPGTDQC